MDITEFSTIISSELLDSLKFYVITVVAGFFILFVLWFSWLSTGTAPLDYYVWLVQLAQSPRRRIIQVFTLNNALSNSRLEQPTEDYHSSDTAIMEESAEMTNGTGNDENAEQTTVVIIQTPYSATRSPNQGSVSSQQDERPIQNIRQSETTLMTDLTRAFHMEFSAGDNRAGGSSGNTSNRSESTLNVSDMDDINSIYHVLRANTEQDIARAATIALYSRSHLLRIANNSTFTTQEQMASSSNRDNSDISNVLSSSDLDGFVADISQNDDTTESGTTQNNSYTVLSSDEIFARSALNSSFSNESTTSSSSSSLGSSFDSLYAPSSQSPRAAGVSENSEPNTPNTTLTSLICESRNAMLMDDSVPSTSGIYSANSSQLNVTATDEVISPSCTGRNFVTTEKRCWDNAVTTIRLKFLDDTQRLVKTWLETSVGDFKRRYFAESLDNGKVVRLIFQGQLLRDDSRSLASYGIHDQCAVHCHVGTKPYHQSQVAQANSNSGQAGRDQFETIDPLGRASSNNIPSVRREDGRNHLGLLSSALISVGASWVELLCLTVWSGLTIIWLWSQNIDENNNVNPPPADDAPLLQRVVDRLRTAVRVVLEFLFDASLFTRTQRRWARGDQQNNPTNINHDEDNQFNFGSIFGFLVAMKISTVWILVLYYPNIADLKSFMFLMLLTVFMMMYFCFHINDSTIRNNRFNINNIRNGIRYNNPNNNNQRWQARVIHH